MGLMDYWFHNRVEFRGSYRIAVSDKELQLSSSESGESVVLTALGAETITKAREAVVQGRGYPSREDAREAGLRWRHYLTDAFARLGIPIDLGTDDDVTPVEGIQEVEPPDWLASTGVKIGDRHVVDVNRPRLLVFNGEPVPRITYARGGTPLLGIASADSLIEQIRRIREKPYKAPDDKAKLAYRLLHSTLNDPTLEAGYIELITAIETLTTDALRSKEVIECLDKFIETVGEWEQEGKVSRETARTLITSILEQNKKDSIRQNIIRLVSSLDGEYDGISPKKFVDKAYGKRSSLVHGEAGEDRPTRSELGTQELRRMVLDLLDTLTTDG
jgi:hypothetical protein